MPTASNAAGVRQCKSLFHVDRLNVHYRSLIGSRYSCFLHFFVVYKKVKHKSVLFPSTQDNKKRRGLNLCLFAEVLDYLSAQIKNKAHVETNVSANFIPRRFDKSV